MRLTAQIAAVIGAAAMLVSAAHADVLNGAGATFPQPLYQKWFQEYKDKTGTEINYQGIGSGGGIKNITAHSVDFGASDAPMSDSELAQAPGIIHIPTVAGAVVLAYNNGIGPGIHLSGDVVADIFAGKITKWDDPRITKLSPGTKFPSTAITPFHRSDGSGTTNIFTTYLSQVSSDWDGSVGHGKSVKWPIGFGGKGNPGVAALIQQTDGGIGYIELAYAVAHNISYAAIRNSKGNFIYPTVEATTIAAEGTTLPKDFRKVITNTSAPKGYPITGFTFLLVYQNGSKPDVKKFLNWMLSDGQASVTGADKDLLYAPLPESVRKRALAAVASMK